MAPHVAYAGDPAFDTRRNFGTGSDATMSVAVGDVDGDGDLDLVTGNFEQQNIVYLNDGAGNFPTGHSFGTGNALTASVAVGDMDGDGDLDLVTGNVRSQSVVYLNDGAGNFPTGHPFGTGNDSTLSLAVGDMDGDGDLDLVAGNRGQNVVYLNDGQGNFLISHPFGTDNDSTLNLAIGDIDGDSDLDLVKRNDGEQSVVYLNDGQGNFYTGVVSCAAPPTSGPTFRCFGPDNDLTVSGVAVGDVDGDSDLDLVTGHDGQSVVYLNDGQSNFYTGAVSCDAPPTTGLIFRCLGPDNDEVGSVAVGDVDGDGDLDLVIGDLGQNRVYLNDGQGNFPTQRNFGPGNHNTTSVAVGDMDDDGDLDLITGNDRQQNVVYLNDGAGSFPTGRNFDPDHHRTSSVAVGDVDGDGDLDLVTGNAGQGMVYLNDGAGNFSANRPFGTSSDSTTSVALGDIDGDGDLDLVVGKFDLYGIVNQKNMVYLNDGAGNFYTGDTSCANPPASGPTFRCFSTGNDHTTTVAVGDIDGDGDLDLVTGNLSQPTPDFQNLGGQNVIYLNDGAGNFPTQRNFGTGHDLTSSVAIGDMDSDGDLDLIIGNGNYGEGVSQNMVYLNDGAGNFPTHRNFGTGTDDTKSVAVGDMDSDGDLDLVTGNQGQNVIYLNDGAGNFPTGHPFGTGNDNTQGVAVGDVDGDDDLDLFVVNLGQYVVEDPSLVYLNDGLGNFSSSRAFGSGSDTNSSVAVGDIDGDGDLDLIVGSSGYGEGEHQSVVYLNDIRVAGALSIQPAQIAITRPVHTDNANFFSSPVRLSNPTIPITYTLFDRDGDAVGRVAAFYSPDGGGRWLPAVATKETITQNLRTGRMVVGALTVSQSIPRTASAPLQAKLTITPSIVLTDVEVWLNVTHANNANLAITLQSPRGTQVPLVATGQAQGQNLQGTRFSALAPTTILSSTAPYTGIYQPAGNLAAFKGELSNGMWTLVITNTGTRTGTLGSWGLRLKSQPMRHVYTWDTFASGFFGQSDNVVLRLVAYPQPPATTAAITGLYRYTNTVAGPDQWPYASATTFPFRVRGTQVRVLDESGHPTANAFVYRLPQGAATGAERMPTASAPLTTTLDGYLSGRGALTIGDQLVALQPMRREPNYTVYATSAAPDEDGLAGLWVTQPGVQTLQVSAAHPLVLFDVDLALEWDAVNDGLFYEQLAIAIQRASALLYDASDGQIALGEVRLHPGRAAWLTADVVIYANNNLRPRASMGGTVDTARDEEQGLRGVLPNAYLPGQVRMGPIWDPFGQNGAELTQDWQRALAHELAHYLLFLPDNYMGVENGLLRITNCQGSLMTDAYNPSYSEFLTPTQWHTPNDPVLNPCLRTMAASLLTGRSDWATITHFYPELHIPAQPLVGPALLPLNVTQARLVVAPTVTALPAPLPVAARNYDLRNENGEVTVLRQAQAYVLQSQSTPTMTDDALLYLGSTGTGSDRILVRGALPGDKVCVLDSASNPVRTGCELVTPQSTSIQVRPVPGWRPDIQVTPLTSTTWQITVTQAISVGPLYAQLLPAYGPVTNAAAIQSIIQPLTPIVVGSDATHYTARMISTYPVFEGFVRVYAAGAPEQQQAITQFFIADPWGPNNGWSGGTNRAWGANIRALEAPAASGDGKVTILNLTDLLADTGSTVLQALTDLPDLPAWLTPVGAGYRFAANSDLARTLMFQYSQRDVPPGYEQTLAIYYLPTGSTNWQRLVTGPLPTGIDSNDNLATVSMPTAGRGEGIYALMATVELPTLSPGWNPFSYPVGATQSVTNALGALGDAFTTVYEYQPAAPLPWPVYDRTVDPFFAPLINTLQTMAFGHNYLIYATQTVTPYLNVVGDGQAHGVTAAGSTGLVEPPATFYGTLAVQAESPLTPGLTVQAKIGDVICGESQLQIWHEQLVYVIQVKADTGDGCGRPGHSVSFAINGNSSSIMGTWDNRQVEKLAPGLKLYLPLIAR